VGVDKFQARYQVHEYPGRKPWYVVRKYVEGCSEPGDVVLDPFCGSGVVPCESLIMRRRAVAFDIDPLAIFISKMTCTSPIDLEKLERVFGQVERMAKNAVYKLYTLEEMCPVCGEHLVISSAARMPDVQQVNVKAICPVCGKFHNLTSDLQDWRDGAGEPIPYWYPRDVELPAGIRGNICYLHELYTTRNLAALSILWHEINLAEDEAHRDMLRLCFSATLSKAAKINVPKSTGKGWTTADYEAYNIPDNFIEFNVWDGFSNKFYLLLEAKAQTNQLIGDFYASPKSADILNRSADDLSLIEDNSIDYALTDPPYADLVRYFERNFVRNTWLGFDDEYPLKEYSEMMPGALREIHRVLKPGRHLSVLLRSTSQQFRDEFVDMAGKAGVTYESTDTEHLGYTNAHHEPADHILNFVNSE